MRTKLPEDLVPGDRLAVAPGLLGAGYVTVTATRLVSLQVDTHRGSGTIPAVLVEWSGGEQLADPRTPVELV